MEIKGEKCCKELRTEDLSFCKLVNVHKIVKHVAHRCGDDYVCMRNDYVSAGCVM